MDLKKLVELAEEKGIDINKFFPANNGIATISEDGAIENDYIPWGKLRSGNGFVKFGKLIMPELDFRDEENYPYLTAAISSTDISNNIYQIAVCESKVKPDVVSDDKVLFSDTEKKRIHVCFLHGIEILTEDEYKSDKWYLATSDDDLMESALTYFNGVIYYEFGFYAFNYDIANEEEILREKDSIESLQGMDFMWLYYASADERITDGNLEDYIKAGEYIEAPSEGMVTFAFIANLEYTFPSDEVEMQAIDGEGFKYWALNIKELDTSIIAVGNDATAQLFGTGETGIYMDYIYSGLYCPVHLIISHQNTDYLVNSQSLTDIANSIRDKLGTSDKMLLSDMPDAIKSIATVGDSITITWDGQPTEESYDDKYYKVSNLYFNGAQLNNATVTLTNGTEEVTGKFNDTRWYTGVFVTGSSGIAWGLDLMLFSTDGTNEDLGVSKGTYIGEITTGDYAGYYVKSITYPVTPNVALQEKTITANGTYSASADYDGFSKVVVEVESGGSGNSQITVSTSSVTVTNADVTVEDESTIVLGG